MMDESFSRPTALVLEWAVASLLVLTGVVLLIRARPLLGRWWPRLRFLLRLLGVILVVAMVIALPFPVLLFLGTSLWLTIAIDPVRTLLFPEKLPRVDEIAFFVAPRGAIEYEDWPPKSE